MRRGAGGRRGSIARAVPPCERCRVGMRRRRHRGRFRPVAVLYGRNPELAITTKALEKLKQEPSVQEVQEAALRYFNVNQDTVSSMRSRASLSAFSERTRSSLICSSSSIAALLTCAGA